MSYLTHSLVLCPQGCQQAMKTWTHAHCSYWSRTRWRSVTEIAETPEQHLLFWEKLVTSTEENFPQPPSWARPSAARSWQTWAWHLHAEKSVAGLRSSAATGLHHSSFSYNCLNAPATHLPLQHQWTLMPNLVWRAWGCLCSVLPSASDAWSVLRCKWQASPDRPSEIPPVYLPDGEAHNYLPPWPSMW